MMKSDLWTRDFDGFKKHGARCSAAAAEKLNSGTPATAGSAAEEISPLITFQMESSVLKGIMDLFTAYVVILESAITGDMDFITNVFSPNADHESGPEIRISRQDSCRYSDLIPSVPYLELYLELKKLQKLSEDDYLDTNWVMSLFREFIIDTQFLVEIARRDEYLSDNALNISKDIVSRVEASFLSAGLSPLRDLSDEEWPANAAILVLHKLQELHANKSLENEDADSTDDEESHHRVSPGRGGNPVGDDRKRQQLLTKIRTLCEALCYEGLVQFYGAFYTPDSGQISIALEYMDGGSFSDILCIRKPISEPILTIMVQKLLIGLSYLHGVRHLVPAVARCTRPPFPATAGFQRSLGSIFSGSSDHCVPSSAGKKDFKSINIVRNLSEIHTQNPGDSAWS
ncbi:mitogen-activated protein kinase kinase 3 [Perilla frutescens var. hirtella]|uniref:Mitogen-activated protein kinase kinase 3 n=1 Tax=Perilla frutescens var. hirtella TaxID=608512 RepID=A0AAD4P882_PERFH|nr:mitogen-activated protein kinase kinase 3 [Perilla frutescens var. hirtella]